MNNTHYLDWDGLVTYDSEIKLKIRETKEDIESRIPTKVADLQDGSNYVTNNKLNTTKLEIISLIPTRVSQLSDESNYVTKNHLSNTLETTSSTIYNNVRNEIPKNVSELNDKDDYVTHAYLENSYDTSIKNFINTTKEQIKSEIPNDISDLSDSNNKYYTQTEVDSKLQEIELTPGPRGASTIYYNGNISESAQSPLIPIIEGKIGDIILSKNGIIAEVIAVHPNLGCTVSVKGSIKGPRGEQGESGVVDYSVLENYTTKLELDTAKYDLNNRITNTDESIRQIITNNEEAISSSLNDLNSRIDEISTTAGPQGPKGDKGDTGEQGPKGDAFTYADFTADQLESLRGPQGEKGDTGTFDTSALEDYATKEYVGNKIAEVVGEAPETLDTLKEIADALSDNATMTDVANAIATKANTADVYNKTEIDSLLSGVETIQGPKGDQGEPGPQGIQGEKGELGLQGESGKSAYEIAVELGYSGTLEEWIVSLKGEQGPKGNTGEQGPKGDKGETGAQGPKGDIGAAFTYDMFTEQQLAALKGEKGETGPQGEPGELGLKGDTGPQGELGPKGDKGDLGDKGDKGDQGTIGPQGPQGIQGMSAYEVAVSLGYEGTENEWLTSLKGDTPHINPTNKHWIIGLNDTGIIAEGKSAYQSYLDTTEDNPVLTEIEWASRTEISPITYGEGDLDSSKLIDFLFIH